jgi:CRP/FNR family transcriptional regulator
MEKPTEFEKIVKPGEILFREGDPGDKMYLIKSGSIKITKAGGDVEKTLAYLKEGDFFGEMAIIDESPRSATATAVEESRLVIIDREAFRNQVKKSPLIEYILETLTRRLRATDEQIKFLLIKNEEKRFVSMLLTKAEEEGVKCEKGVLIKTHLSYENFGDLIGVDRQKGKDIIQKFVKSGLIELDGEHVVVRSLEELKEYFRYISLRERFEK